MVEPTNRPTQPTEALTVAEAAERLGISPNAVWQRLKRGTLTKADEPGPDGEALVPLDPNRPSKRRKRSIDRPTQADRPTEATEPSETAPDADRLLARLEQENAYRRQLLDAEIEARRRADHLLAGALERLAVLPSSTDETASTNAPVAANQAPGRTESAATASEPSPSVWTRLRRWLRGD